MKRIIFILHWIFVFLCLDLYVNLVPRYLPQTQIGYWILYWVGFFILIYLAVRYLLKLKDLCALGLQWHRNWGKNLIFGFSIGALVFFLKYLCCYEMGMFRITVWMEMSYITQMLMTAIVAMFFASAINDTLIRGYWLAFCTRKSMMKWYIPLVTILYALDDSWNEGLILSNFLYSLVLGITLAYTVYKTKSIWMSIGLHWGSNVLFRAMYGFNNQGILKIEHVLDGPKYYFASLLVTSLMFPMVLLLLKKEHWYGKQQLNSTS